MSTNQDELRVVSYDDVMNTVEDGVKCEEEAVRGEGMAQLTGGLYR